MQIHANVALLVVAALRADEPGVAPASEPVTQFAPEVGDAVTVAFERGDLRAPVVLGSLWNSPDAPPATRGSANAHRAVPAAEKRP